MKTPPPPENALPDLTPYQEITFGPAFHVPPLRGLSCPLAGPPLAGKTPGSLIFTLLPVESEFDTHTIDFTTYRTDGSFLTLYDASGGMLLTFAPLDVME